jgi:hypothetical protein
MTLSIEEIEKYRDDGVLAGHCICTPPLGLIIQGVTLYYSEWERSLDRPVTDAMAAVWLAGLGSFLSRVHLETRSPPQQPSPPPPAEPRIKRLTSLRELALLLKMDRSAARRYVLKLGVAPVKARTSASGFQEALVFTEDQVRQIVEARRTDGYC